MPQPRPQPPAGSPAPRRPPPPYYAIEAAQGEGGAALDNPDQRIAEDVASFTRASLRFLVSVLRAVIDLFSFSAILYSIYPQLFGVILAYAAVGTAATVRIGRQLVGLNYEQLRTEADFRFSLVRLRENAEAIAFFGGEDLERREARSKLGAAVDNRGRVIAAERNLEYFTTAYQFLIQVLPGVVVAPLYFSGAIQLGVVSQSFGAFNHILNDFSIIINQFEALSSFSAGVDRLREFTERCEGSSAGGGGGEGAGEGGAIRITEAAAGSPLTVRGLRLRTPDGRRELFRGVSLDLSEQRRVLVVGESGAGKSSLLRAVAGLWTNGEGEVARPENGPGGTFFLPQRPYCPPGSLRDQVAYPSVVDAAALGAEELAAVDRRIRAALAEARLAALADRWPSLAEVQDWGQILSLGEQQRLAFARLLYNGARLAILDEATSALDVENEAAMYEAMQRMPGIAYLSVGHRPSLEAFHDRKVRIGGGGAGAEEGAGGAADFRRGTVQ